MALAVFWSMVALIVYVYVGYPCLVFLLASLRPRPVRKGPELPTVSFIIAAYNEEASIADKLRNTLALEYPSERLQIIVASDGSTDRTEEIVRSEFAGRVTLVAAGRHGKMVAQNRAVAEAATGDIILFSDATTVYRPECLRALVASFADPEVGLATGNVIHGLEVNAGVVKGRAAYWNYENFVRRHESRFDSILGAAGCFHALRRRLYTPLAPDLIGDVVQTVKVVQQGYRAVVEEEAVVYEPAESTTIREELERRARVIARGLRGKWYLRDFFNPFRHPWFCVQVLSHRILRWSVPLFLIGLLLANLALLDRPLYRAIFGAQVAFYALAALGWALERRRLSPPGLTVPFYFCVINLAPLLALRSLLRGERKTTWETGRTEAGPERG
jgi:cellulose synthase/poly-beta-1,6-N-acetylglucosamine synthase-like glycosyltransferase